LKPGATPNEVDALTLLASPPLATQQKWAVLLEHGDASHQ
jgi:hypothetical protein